MSESVTIEQQEALIEFLERHKELALGRFTRTKEGRGLSKRLWTECSNILNGVSANCPTKTPDAWRTYYADYKCKLMRRVKKNKQEISATGGGGYSQAELTPLQDRLLTILGRDIGEPLPGVSHNPIESVSPLDIPLETNEDGDGEIHIIETPWEPMEAPPAITSTTMFMTRDNQPTFTQASGSRRSTDRDEPPRRRRRRHHRELEPELTPLQSAEQRLQEMESQSAESTFALARAIQDLASAIRDHGSRPLQIEIVGDRANPRHRRLQSSDSDN